MDVESGRISQRRSVVGREGQTKEHEKDSKRVTSESNQARRNVCGRG
jgi:hypothetical protein